MAAILKILIICMLIISILPFNSGIAQPATNNWEITGNTVFIEDENAYLSATPHTVSSSGWVEFIVTPKSYTGDIDICWGFDTSTVKPTKAEYYSPYWNNWTTTHSQTFEKVSDYSITTLTPDFGEDNEYNQYHYAVAYQQCSNYNEITYECEGYETVTSTVYFSDVTPKPPVMGEDCTVTWIEKHSELIHYIDVSGAFESVDLNYEGMNKWYYKKNFFVTAGNTYKLRMWVDMPISEELTSGKYFWAVKPSSKTIQEAIAQDCFYALDPWYSSSWDKRKQWTVTNVNSTALTNFAAYINVSDESEMQADYDDVVFTDSNSVLIPFELENYTASFADYWVNVTIPGSSSVTGWMYYSNAGATSLEDMEGVWDSNYKMVQHLQNMTDSTSYSNDGTNNGATYNQSGMIDGAYDFDGASYINCGNDPSLAFNGGSQDFSIEARIKRNLAGVEESIVDKRDANDDGYRLIVAATNLIYLSVDEIDVISSSTITDTNWHHIVGVIDRDGNGQLYIDRVADGNAVAIGGNAMDTIINVNIGKVPYTTANYYDGTIDEVRISSTARSSDWINQSYEMVVNQSTWVTWGAEEEEEVPPYEQIRLLKEPKQMLSDMLLFVILFAAAFGLSAYSWLGLGSYFYTDVIAGAMAFIMFFAVAFYSITTLEQAWLAMLTTMFGLVQTLYVSIKVFDIFRSVVEA